MNSNTENQSTGEVENIIGGDDNRIQEYGTCADVLLVS